jgi:hypothetical protein
MTEQTKQVLLDLYNAFRKHYFEEHPGEGRSENDAEAAFLLSLRRRLIRVQYGRLPIRQAALDIKWKLP